MIGPIVERVFFFIGKEVSGFIVFACDYRFDGQYIYYDGLILN